MNPSKRVTIIIPTYNEKENISPVVNSLSRQFKQLKKYDFSILFVDDNSPDGTASEIKHVMRVHPEVKLYQNVRKGGLGRAYKKGMRYALDKLGSDVVFEFDADLSHDPTKIGSFLQQIESGSDMVLGSRYIKGGGIPQNWPLIRKLLSVVGNAAINIILFDFSLRDWTTGYRAIKREVVEKIVPELDHNAFKGYTWQIGFLIKSRQSGFKVSEIPFIFRDREKGKSKLGPEFIVNTLKYILKVRINSIVTSRIFKFVVVGGIGAFVQLTSLIVWRKTVSPALTLGFITPFQIAFFLSIETAIISNFILSNIWTFADRKLKPRDVPKKFLTFNLTSGGSILIQQIVALVGENTLGLFPLFTLPLAQITLDTGTLYAVTGILIGMFWNFFAYSRIIWRKQK